jgi:hypothetical protein
MFGWSADRIAIISDLHRACGTSKAGQTLVRINSAFLCRSVHTICLRHLDLCSSSHAPTAIPPTRLQAPSLRSNWHRADDLQDESDPCRLGLSVRPHRELFNEDSTLHSLGNFAPRFATSGEFAQTRCKSLLTMPEQRVEWRMRSRRYVPSSV